MMSCVSEQEEKSDFYTTQKEFDLWRVPLLEPYEIVSPNNANDWFLILEDPHISGPDFMLNGREFQLTNITKIGIKDSVIVIENRDQYWPKLSGMYSSVLIINPKTNNHLIYSKEHHQDEIQLKTKEFDLNGIHMVSWSKIRDDYQKKGELPEEWKM